MPATRCPAATARTPRPPGAGRCGRRALALLTALDPEARAARAQFDGGGQHDRADGGARAARRARAGRGGARRPSTRAWAHDRLVIDKWFAVQGSLTPPEAAVETVERLTRHPDFDWKNPNRFRSLRRRLRRRQSGRLPPGRRRRLPAARRLADPARPGEPADHGADGDEPRHLADVRRRPAAADPGRARAAGGAAGAVARHRRDRRPVVARGTRLRVPRLSRRSRGVTILTGA